MLRIGEFAWLGHVSTHTLRHYDDVGLLKPIRVDDHTGYRYYAPNQLPRLNRILALKDLGLPLEQIEQMMDQNLSKADIKTMLQGKQTEVKAQIQDLKGRLDRIQIQLDHLEMEHTMPEYDIHIKTVDAKKMAAIRETIPSYSQDVFGPALGRMFQTLGEHLGKQGLGFAGPGMTIYHDSHGGSENTSLDVEVATPISKPIPETDQVKMHDFPKSEVAYIVHHGSYAKLGFIKRDLFTWAYDNGYQLTAPVREVYLHHDQQSDGTGDSPHHVTEIQLPIEKTPE